MKLLNIFNMILLSSFIGSLFVLIILIIKGIFRNKLSSTFHYYIWLILLIKLIIPFGPQTPLNIFTIYSSLQPQSTTNEKAQETQVNSSSQLENKTPVSSISNSTVKVKLSNKDITNNTVSSPLKSKITTQKILCFIWMFGVVILALILVAGHRKLEKIIKISNEATNNSHKEILYNSMQNMNIRTKTTLLYSKQINTPCLCHLFKPKILIPINVAKSISDEEFKYIIMHELTHLKKKDMFLNLIITLLSTVYWFNPILLYGFHKMRQDCEFSCDSKVISYLDKNENIHYGNALIRVLELSGNSNRLVGTTSLVMNSSEIKRRILMISKYKKINIKSMLLGTVVVITISGLAISLNTSKISPDKNIAKTSTLANTPIAITPNKIDTTSNIKIEKLSSNYQNPVAPFSSDIVIYNSHPSEDYPSGVKVTDVGKLINDKLIKEGLKSNFIMCKDATEYGKSYKNTRNIITKNVKGYSNTILLDIHRDTTENPESTPRKLQFVLAKNNPHYEANKKFVDTLLENIKNSNKVEATISIYENGLSYFNQDLSNNSVIIEIGNNKSSDNDIEECVNALVSALK